MSFPLLHPPLNITYVEMFAVVVCDVITVKDLYCIFIGVTIEMSLNRDQSLTIVVTGKPDAVLKARRMIINQLQTQVNYTG